MKSEFTDIHLTLLTACQELLSLFKSISPALSEDFCGGFDDSLASVGFHCMLLQWLYVCVCVCVIGR